MFEIFGLCWLKIKQNEDGNGKMNRLLSAMELEGAGRQALVAPAATARSSFACCTHGCFSKLPRRDTNRTTLLHSSQHIWMYICAFNIIKTCLMCLAFVSFSSCCHRFVVTVFSPCPCQASQPMGTISNGSRRGVCCLYGCDNGWDCWSVSWWAAASCLGRC